MPDSAKRQGEREILRRLFEFIGRELPAFDQGENPDFIVPLDGKQVGIEVTWYHTREMTDDGLVGARQASAEWYKFRKAAEQFSAQLEHLKTLTVYLQFKGAIPNKRTQQAFLEELSTFALERRAEYASSRREYSRHHFTTPLVQQYLRIIELHDQGYPYWASNNDSGWVARPDDTITDIAVAKIKKDYPRPTDALWLAIAGGYHKGEFLGINLGVEDFDAMAGWKEAMQHSPMPFQSIFVLTIGSGFEWNTEQQQWRSLKPSK